MLHPLKMSENENASPLKVLAAFSNNIIQIDDAPPAENVWEWECIPLKVLAGFSLRRKLLPPTPVRRSILLVQSFSHWECTRCCHLLKTTTSGWNPCSDKPSVLCLLLNVLTCFAQTLSFALAGLLMFVWCHFPSFASIWFVFLGFEYSQVFCVFLKQLAVDWASSDCQALAQF